MSLWEEQQDKGSTKAMSTGRAGEGLETTRVGCCSSNRGRTTPPPPPPPLYRRGIQPERSLMMPRIPTAFQAANSRAHEKSSSMSSSGTSRVHITKRVDPALGTDGSSPIRQVLNRQWPTRFGAPCVFEVARVTAVA